MSAHGHHASKETVVEGISSLDEPSVEWGWHQHSSKVGWVVGGFFVLFLLAMLIGNHVGNVENLWLLGIAAVAAIWMVSSLRKGKDKTLQQSRIYELPRDHYSLVDTAASGAVRSAATGGANTAPAKR